MTELEPHIRALVGETLASVLAPMPLPGLGTGPVMCSRRNWLD